ncbi:MAG TPA: carboxymuconolactone decarboxylase family protein [Bacteroidia bacterium]
MEKRININEVEPQAYKAMYALVNYLNHSSIGHELMELIKIRASQINACAFCLDMHTKDALKLGITQQKIFLLNAWKETHLFSDSEKAALALTEEVTLIHRGGVSNETYDQLLKYFDEHQIAQLIMAIVTINSWNRMAISTHLEIPE